MNRILFVDDDQNVLAGLRRQFRKDFEVDCAEGAKIALSKFEEGANYAVVVSDMRMPEVSGVEFLATLARKYPDPIRIMLTGNADQQTAIDAVNKGHVFSFLSKPCAPEDMTKVLTVAVEQYRLKSMEKDLLEQTLAGSVKMLLDVMHVINPLAFGRSCALREPAVAIAKALGARNLWEIKIATLLSPLGWMSIPDHLLEKVNRRRPLDQQERELVALHPEVAYSLIKSVPRLKEVGRIIRYQDRNFDGSGRPVEPFLAGEDIPLGSRILKVLNARSPLDQPRPPQAVDFANMAVDGVEYDPAVVVTARQVLADFDQQISETRQMVLEIEPRQLLSGDILEEDLITEDGTLLLGAGFTVSELHLAKLRFHPKFGSARHPILVTRFFR